MKRIVEDSSVKKGLAPGSLVFVGEKKTSKTTFEFFRYNSNDYCAVQLSGVDEIEEHLRDGYFYWLNIDGLSDVESINAVGKKFDIHKLALEDILNTNQRPKVEEYENFLFLSLKMIWINPKSEEISSEQISICLFENMVISFQEKPGDVFDSIRERFKIQSSRLRNFGPDYLCYILLDTIVDNYIFISEQTGLLIENLENDLLEVRGNFGEKRIIRQISEYKQDVNFLRKNIRPAHEIVLRLVKTSNALIRKENQLYLKDLLDLSALANENIELYREILSDQLMIFQVNVGNKLNQIMKVLTVFSAIFIPLTFITGVYGTNFEYIPELHHKMGFYFFLGFLSIIGLATLWYFKRNKWL